MLITGVMKAAIYCYLSKVSKVYACLIDAWKAFDTVDHSTLFHKLLERRLPKPIVRLLLHWYKTQKLQVQWVGKVSLLWGLQWGSPRWYTQPNTVHNLYSWSARVILCKWAWLLLGASLLWGFMLSTLSYHCHSVPWCSQNDAHPLWRICSGPWDLINASTTQLICFAVSDGAHFSLCGQCFPLPDSVAHLGKTLQHDLFDKLHI